jgi:hypothetical protein
MIAFDRMDAMSDVGGVGVGVTPGSPSFFPIMASVFTRWSDRNDLPIGNREGSLSTMRFQCFD